MTIFDSFSPELRRALGESGWTPERSVEIGAWHEVLGAEGFFLSDLAKELLAGLGGLRIPSRGTGPYRAALLVEPELAGSGAFDIARELETLFAQRFYPLGEWISDSCVFVGEHGRVASYDEIETLDLGETVSEALELIVLTAAQPRVIRPAG